MPEPGGIAASDFLIAVILLGTLLVLSMAGAAAALVIGPRRRLKRRMALLGLADEPAGKQPAQLRQPAEQARQVLADRTRKPGRR